MNTATAAIAPSAPNVAPEGIFVAQFFLGTDPYALVLSPRAGGEFDKIVWNKSNKRVAGAASYVDGLANTRAMAAAGSKLAEQVLALRMDGHDDWYLPSRIEALLLFGERPEEFDKDWYWTSTQSAADGDDAWIQTFITGLQYAGHKSFRCRARAVRRVPL